MSHSRMDRSKKTEGKPKTQERNQSERKETEQKYKEETSEEAEGRGDHGQMYRTLKELGRRGYKGATDRTTITKEEFRDHFKAVSENRFENTPQEIEEAVNECEDLREDETAREGNDMLEQTPEREEILEEMKKMRDSSPGKDGVRLIMLMKGGEEVISRVVKLVQFMFNNSQDKWEDELKIGLVIPLHKKGDRNERNNYRGVVLLAMGSRILARIMANRLRI